MEPEEEFKNLHVIVEGHVQGVGFRYFVKENADLLSLTGWVRNRYDGSVELMAEGEVEKLNRFLEAVKNGPSFSMVTNVRVEWNPVTHQFTQFSFLATD